MIAGSRMKMSPLTKQLVARKVRFNLPSIAKFPSPGRLESASGVNPRGLPRIDRPPLLPKIPKL